MPSNLTETPNTYPTTVAAPVAGEPRTASSVRAPLTDLLNRTGALESRLDVAEELANTANAISGSAAITFGSSLFSDTSGGVGDFTATNAPLLLAYPNGNIYGGILNAWFVNGGETGAWPFTQTGGTVFPAGVAPFPSNNLSCMTAGTILGSGRLVAVSDETTTVRMSSDLGGTWSNAGTTPVPATHCGRRNETFLATNGSSIYYSSDLASWSTATIGADPLRPAFGIFDSGAGHSIRVQAEPDGSGSAQYRIIHRTTNASTWTQHLLPTFSGPKTVVGCCYNTQLDLWMITTSGGLCWTSADGGITWVDHVAPTDIRAVAALGPVFVACRSGGGLYASFNSGSSWIYLHERATIGNWQSIIAADMRLIVAGWTGGGGDPANEIEFRMSGRLPPDTF